MELTPLGANQTELAFDPAGGEGEWHNLVLFSYQTPVAAITPEGAFRTAKKWSKTTTKHVNQWFAEHYDQAPVERPQEFFDNLVAWEAKGIEARL